MSLMPPLLSDYRVQINHWQLLLLDSSVVGEVVDG